MNKRPLWVTIISYLYVAAGVVGILYHASELKAQHPFQSDVIWVLLLRLTAIVSGVFMLRGRNWARWLAVVWIAYHVILSGFHSLNELAVHAVLLAASTYVLFRPGATKYFRGAKSEPESGTIQ